MQNNPFLEFITWIVSEGFVIDKDYINPNLPFTLSTVSGNGFPSSRVLYLKKLRNNELVFFSNKESRKGKEIMANTNVSLCFFFEKSFKQIRIEGKAFLCETSEAEEYFNSRNDVSKASAILSKQSEHLGDYNLFVESVVKYNNSSDKAVVKCPEHWAGFRVLPELFEFWIGSASRMHSRTVFKKDLNSENLWNSYHLYP